MDYLCPTRPLTKRISPVSYTHLDVYKRQVQWWLDNGFDFCGWPVSARFDRERTTSFSGGTFAFIRADTFWKLGGYDEEFFMYGEEEDLAWRIWLGGGNVVAAPNARLHHRSEVSVNPKGGEQITEFRTSERKRFYANRNHLLVLLKHSQHILLLTAGAFAGMLFVEGVFWLLLKRRWSLAQATSLEPVSYTHLDVYKRQAARNAGRRNRSKSGRSRAQRLGAQPGLHRCLLYTSSFRPFATRQGFSRANLCQIPKRIFVGTRSKFLLVFVFIGRFCLNPPVRVVMKSSRLL